MWRQSFGQTRTEPGEVRLPSGFVAVASSAVAFADELPLITSLHDVTMTTTGSRDVDVCAGSMYEHSMRITNSARTWFSYECCLLYRRCCYVYVYSKSRLSVTARYVRLGMITEISSLARSLSLYAPSFRHRRRRLSSVNFGGKPFLPENIEKYEKLKLTKCQNFT